MSPPHPLTPSPVQPRVPYDSLTLRCASQEIARRIVGGQVQHVAQPAQADLVLTVRSGGANHLLTLSCDARYARAHLTSVKRPNPPAPPAFCMLCRKYLENGFVREVRQRGFDRILDITVEGPGGTWHTLVAELMGKHSNLILVAESGAILDAAKRITRRMSRFREVLPGQPYIAPPAQEGLRDPFAATQEELREVGSRWSDDLEAGAARLMRQYAGLSPFLAAELAARAQALGRVTGDGGRTDYGSVHRHPSPLMVEAWEEIFGAAKAGEWMPVLIRDDRAQPVGAYPFPTVQFPPEAQHARDSLNTALDHYYSVALPRAALDAAQHDLLTTIDRAMKSRETKRESLRRSLEEAGRAEEHRKTGELLLANLHRIQPEADSVVVEDVYEPGAPERVIPLDPLKSPQENAEVYFRRYRKVRDGVRIQQEQLAEAEEDLQALREARRRAEATGSVEELRKLKVELSTEGLIRGEAEAPEEPKKWGRDFRGKKIRVFTTPEGWEIYLGENSEANDFLTGRVAAPNDLWFHVRAAASAHVVIRTRNNPGAVPRSVLERAAVLAAQHSPSKHAKIVPVDYTLKRYVRRPRGAPSGTVLYQNEKTLHVDPRRGTEDGGRTEKT